MCIAMWIDVCIGMCICTCMDMCIDMCRDICVKDKCIPLVVHDGLGAGPRPHDGLVAGPRPHDGLADTATASHHSCGQHYSRANTTQPLTPR